MIKHFSSFEEIDIPKDENGNYIVDDPDLFDSTYYVYILDRGHSNGSKIAKQKKVFVNLMVYSFKCKKCGKLQTRSFRWAHIDAHKTLLCQDCLNISRYGYAHTYDNPEKQKYALGRIVEEHGGYTLSKGSDIRELTLDEIERRYGHRCSLKNDTVLQKAKDKNLAKLGVEFPLQSKVIQEVIRDGYQEKTGFRYPLQNPEVKEKQKQNIIEKFGVDNPMKVPEIQEKSMQNRKQKYIRHGIRFDSKWELAFWIYQTEGLNNQSIKRTNKYYEFTVPGDTKVHKYYPDFELNGEIVEIKGDHFYENRDPTARMINPFDRSEDPVFEAKQKCAIEHGVKFIDHEEIEKAIQFVTQKYGNGYLDIWCIDKNSFPYPEPRFDRPQTIQTYFENLIKKYHKSIYHAKVHGCKYSPYEAWFDKDFVEVVAQNRAIYSEYADKLSPKSILHGFSVTKKATKVSVFSVSTAYDLIQKYLNDVSCIFDPFSGFSGRMLGVIQSGKIYYGQDGNFDHVNESNEIIRVLVNSNRGDYTVSSQVIQKDIFNSEGCYESLFTCPPYKDKEDWQNENQITYTCDEWIDECLKRFKCKKYLFVVDDTEKYKDYVVDVIENKSHFGKNCEKVILITNLQMINQNQYTYPYIMLPIPMSYWAFVNGAMFQAYTMNNGMGVTPFDKVDDKGYAIHPDDEVGVTPFDLD